MKRHSSDASLPNIITAPPAAVSHESADHDQPVTREARVNSEVAEHKDATSSTSEFLCAKCGKAFKTRGSFTVHSIVCGKEETRRRAAEDEVKAE